MSQQIREQVSALMDGELSRDETAFLLRRMEHEPALVASWSRFHMARQVLRRQEWSSQGLDLAGRVLAAIESDSQPVARHGRWLRWASGGAIAASVAAAAHFITAPDPSPTADPTLATNVNAGSVPSAIPANGGTHDFRPPMIAPPLDVQPASAATSGFGNQGGMIDPRLQSYLIRHYGAAGSAAQPGLMPYVLLVTPAQQATRETSAEPVTEQR